MPYYILGANNRPVGVDFRNSCGAALLRLMCGSLNSVVRPPEVIDVMVVIVATTGSEAGLSGFKIQLPFLMIISEIVDPVSVELI